MLILAIQCRSMERKMSPVSGQECGKIIRRNCQPFSLRGYFPEHMPLLFIQQQIWEVPTVC